LEISNVAALSPVKDTEGLSNHEVVGLVTVAKSTDAEDDAISAYLVRQDMRKAGFTDIAVTLAMRSLIRKGMVAHRSESDYNNTYIVYSVTDKGMEWLEANQDQLALRATRQSEKKAIPPSPFT